MKIKVDFTAHKDSVGTDHCRDSGAPDGDCPPPPRPTLGFMLDDAEMLGRLEHLYGSGRAEAIGREWEALRGRESTG